MFDYLDGLLQQLLSSQIPAVPANRIGFSPPDKDWRTFVSTAMTNALNVYLVELRENRNLRSNQVVREQVNGLYQDTPAPPRLDCIYLISAWSPIAVNPLVESAIEEEVLLYGTAQALMGAAPFDATAIYAPNPLPAGFPDALLEPLPPVVVAPSDGFAKLADFWMRMDWVWKPVVELIVTIPVVRVGRMVGPPVTTIVEHFLQSDGHPIAATLEELITVGGVVRANGLPVATAWVRLVELGDIRSTNGAGQFTFTGLARGTYTLEAGATGFPARQRTLQIPSDSGEYDLSLT